MKRMFTSLVAFMLTLMATMTVALVVLSWNLVAHAGEAAAIGGKASAALNMDEPPFWMFSYDEFKDLQDNQKALYYQSMEKQLAKVPALKSVKTKQLKEASEWEKSWDGIRKQIYGYCAKSRNSKDILKKCTQIAKARTDALELEGNRKIENRDASPAGKKENGED